MDSVIYFVQRGVSLLYSSEKWQLINYFNIVHDLINIIRISRIITDNRNYKMK
jgi:hypothetical protein